MIQAKLVIAVDSNPQDETQPQFLHSKFVLRIFWVTCANESSKTWVMRTVIGHGELWEGAELTVVDSNYLPKRPRVIVRIPDTSEVITIMIRLRIQNPESNTTNWTVMSRKVTEKEQTLALCTELTRSNFKAFWGFGRVIFRTLLLLSSFRKILFLLITKIVLSL